MSQPTAFSNAHWTRVLFTVEVRKQDKGWEFVNFSLEGGGGGDVWIPPRIQRGHSACWRARRKKHGHSCEKKRRECDCLLKTIHCIRVCIRLLYKSELFSLKVHRLKSIQGKRFVGVKTILSQMTITKTLSDQCTEISVCRTGRKSERNAWVATLRCAYLLFVFNSQFVLRNPLVPPHTNTVNPTWKRN